MDDSGQTYEINCYEFDLGLDLYFLSFISWTKSAKFSNIERLYFFVDANALLFRSQFLAAMGTKLNNVCLLKFNFVIWFTTSFASFYDTVASSDENFFCSICQRTANLTKSSSETNVPKYFHPSLTVSHQLLRRMMTRV